MVEHYSDTVGDGGSSPSITTRRLLNELDKAKWDRALSGGVTANIPEFESGVTGSNPVLISI